MTTVLRDNGEGRQAISLAALAASVERALEAAHRSGADPDTIEPRVKITLMGKIKQIEIEIP